MCIRDSGDIEIARDLGRVALGVRLPRCEAAALFGDLGYTCLLYTSDAADERSSVDLGGRRIIKKK